ncbi:glycosyltransferase family 2 protein [Thermostaphylospora chromogena]|uniref:Glycosyltransferase, GT2 family n=1 Tax=Thermostaphylospora chromogena TaxID=35622 RepID=A0A1H0ZZA9_9ACTN|nr:glycosyltransferase family A protein [Thermostaphylospora chromogena]SDQ32767.1 Glycosyltransferase, GT2 family [Thermostaphylospora chromogena]
MAESDAPSWPEIGVVIATRGDRPEMLREALKGITSQDYPGTVRTVVVFDGTEPDRTLESDDPLRPVRLTVNQRTKGLPGGRNTGILTLPDSAEWVAFCDDDDTWLPTKLRAQVEALRRHPDAAFATCGSEIVHPDWTRHIHLAKERVPLADLLDGRQPAMHPSSFLIRRSALIGDAIGLFSEEIPKGYGEDYEMMLRGAKHAPIVHVPESHLHVRMHGQSHFAGRWNDIAEALQWLLVRHPEIRTSRKGYSRLAGQVAFTRVAVGRRGEALRWALRAFMTSPREIRSYAVAAIAILRIDPAWVVRKMEARGLGAP